MNKNIDNEKEQFLTRLYGIVSQISSADGDTIDVFMRQARYLASGEYNSRSLFDYVNEGAFKIVFKDAALPRWVIKIASEADDTDYEREMYEIARRSNFRKYFPETIYLKLPAAVTDLAEEAGDEEGLAKVYEDYAYLILQESVTTYYDYGKGYDDPKKVLSNALYERVSDVMDGDIGALKWTTVAASLLGEDEVFRLMDFIQKYNIQDLHPGNLGFAADGHPVILDWFSDHR